MGDDAGSAWPGSRHTLTRFIGRESETADLEQQVRDARLVTLVGPPGAGKTRLAAAASEEAGGAFRDGVHPVALAGVSAPGDVLGELATRLGVRAGRETLTDALLGALHGQETLLLLDNCEHVAGAVAELVERLLTTAPGVRVLATSRIPLDVPGEQLYRVPPLDRPDAYELFVDRARLVTDPVHDEDWAAWVHRICRRLDGLPLAIELAARQARVLSLSDLSARLDSELARAELPGAADPGSPTMTATIAWSSRLLSPAQNYLFERLSVFLGAFDVHAVEAVAEGDGELMAQLEVLVDHSLLLAEPAMSGSLHYRMLEPIRQYAAARLAERGATDPVRARHAQHCLRAARTAARGLMGAGGHHRYAELRALEANVLAAVAWSRGSSPDLALQLLICLSGYWQHRGHVLEATTRLTELLEQVPLKPRTRAGALLALAELVYRREQYELARRHALELIPIMEELGDRDGLARGLRAQARACSATGDHEVAIATATRSVEVFREIGDRLGEAWSLSTLGSCLFSAGRIDEGLDVDLRSWRIVDSEPEAPTVARSTHIGLAYAYANRGETAAHRRHLTASITALHQIGSLDGDTEWLWGAVSLAHQESRFASTLRLAALARARGRRGTGLVPFVREFCELAINDAAQRLGAHRAEELAEEGARMSTEQALGEALGRPDVDAQALTPREREVARLTGQGLSNAEIAAELVISRRTVESHQDHIRRKLRMGSRYEVIAWAMAGSV